MTNVSLQNLTLASAVDIKTPDNSPLAYLDTCIVSGLGRNDLAAEEGEAMIQLLGLMGGQIRFVTSAIALSELEQIPRRHQVPHLAVYHLLSKVPALSEPSLTRFGPLGVMTNPNRWTWNRIESLLPDKNDVKHVYQAVEHRMDYFVTVDEKTILKHKVALASEVGVRAVKPCDLLRLVKMSDATEIPNI